MFESKEFFVRWINGVSFMLLPGAVAQSLLSVGFRR